MNNCTDCIIDTTDACPRGAGRADVIEELKPYVLTNMDGKQFMWLKVEELNKLSFAEELKEQKE